MTTRTRTLFLAALLVGVVALAFRPVGPRGASANQPTDADYRDFKVRSRVDIRGVFRDFPARSAPGGHPDFGLLAAGGRGAYFRIAADSLDGDARPVFASSGYKRIADWLDASQRPIAPARSYIAALSGDVAGAMNPVPGGAVTSAASFAQWYRDGAPARVSAPMPFTLTQDGSHYVFDGSFDAIRSGAPADFTYTYELDTFFIFERRAGFYLSIDTTCDAWAFLDDKLVIDAGKGIGSIRPAIAVQETLTLSNSASVIAGPGGSVSTNSTAADAITLANSASIQGDVLVGPGGAAATGIEAPRAGSITGATGVLAEPVPIAIVSAPTGMPPSQGDLSLTRARVTWDRDLHVANLTISNHSEILVNSPVRVLVDKSFVLEISSKLIIGSGGSLEIYVMEDVNIKSSSEAITTSPEVVGPLIACLGVGKRIVVDNYVEFTGTLVAPYGDVTIGNHSVINGTITARSATLQNNCTVNGSGGAGGIGGSGGILAAQRIDLDRLNWLTHGNTHRLRMFFANRTGSASRATLRTNITTLNLARLPITPEPGHD